jgi:cytochrome d ubiquinol oxidase subunit I
VQILAGDLHGLNTLEHQPAKVAAMEGHFETMRGAPLILFGLPDMAAEETRWAVQVPRLGSLILTHDWDGEVKGLKAWPPEDRPHAPLVFWTFRVMVGLGFLMVALGLWSLVARARGNLFDSPWLARAAVAMAPSGFIAILAGWITTEVGRQPWTVQGLLRTADSVSPVAAPAVAASLIAFVVVYFLVFGFGLFFMLRMMARPPQAHEIGPDKGEPTRVAGIVPGPMQRSGRA